MRVRELDADDDDEETHQYIRSVEAKERNLRSHGASACRRPVGTGVVAHNSSLPRQWAPVEVAFKDAKGWSLLLKRIQASESVGELLHVMRMVDDRDSVEVCVVAAAP